MSAYTYAELFAGAGGLSIGLELAGWEAVAHAEIEPHARAVLRRHWPDVRLDGDVAQLNGADYQGVTLLSGGSPCQDLSIAGKRAGMTEGSGTRSSLFFDQMRIWDQSGAPYCLWENVLGAFSSNKGKDFAAVLSAFVGGAVAVPADGWSGAGVVRGPAAVAAWRVLDAQFFGVPQRRRRVFVLGARAGGVDPAEVLSLSESVRGDSAAGREAGEGTAADAGGGVKSEGGCLTPWDTQSRRLYRTDQPFPALSSNASGGLNRQAIVPVVAPALDAGEWRGPNRNQGGVIAVGNHAQNWAAQSKASPVVFPIQNPELDKQQNGSGIGSAGDPMFTLESRGHGVVFTKALVNPTLMTTHYTKHSGSNQHVSELAEIIPAIGIPRRITPRECERLMGWADDWTAVGIDEQGREYQLSDTARYKLCGNGVASPVAAWIGHRLREAIQATP